MTASTRLGLATLIFALAACTAPVASSGAEPSTATEVLQFRLYGMACDTCAQSAAGTLASIPDVEAVTVDFDTKRDVVRSARTVAQEEVRNKLKSLGFEVRFGDEPAPAGELEEDKAEQLDIEAVTHGGRFDVADHLAPGKYTVFDYYADWCGPCRLLTPKLERLVRDEANVALRKVDIVKWSSGAARQATFQFGRPGLPHVRIYRPDGTFLGAVEGNDFDAVVKLIDGDRR